MKSYSKIKLFAVLTLALQMATLGWSSSVAFAASVTNASVTLSDSRPSQTGVVYTQGFTFPGTATIKCIKIQYTTTATGSTVPTAMDTTSTTKDSFSGGGLTGAAWTLDNSVNGTILYTNAGGEASTATALTIVNGAIVNPNSQAVFYVKYSTFNNTDCSSSPVDGTTVAAFATTNGVTISVTVNPTLTFTVAGVAQSTVYKGALSTSAGCTDTATAVSFPANMAVNTDYDCAQSLTTSTNASNGYTVTLRGTVAGDDLVDGVNSITDFTGTNAAPTAWGPPAEGFGYTTSDATLGTGTAGRFTADDTWAAMTNTAVEVAYSSAPVSSQAVYVGYRVRLQGTTKAGSYSGTAIYTITPVF